MGSAPALPLISLQHGGAGSKRTAGAPYAEKYCDELQDEVRALQDDAKPAPAAAVQGKTKTLPDTATLRCVCDESVEE